MFEGFERARISANGVSVYAVHNLPSAAGKPPLLLLHGYPQSHVMWHKVAPKLAPHFALVIPDLRGYGASDKPPGGEGHINYSKRAMAADQIALMRALGFARFSVGAHDRGARVTHRMALDHPDRIERIALLDIAPTLAMYEQTTMEFASRYWWWFFLIQPAPFPEKLITAQPDVYLKKKIGYGSAGLTPFTDQTYAAYLSGVSDYATVHAMCEDYRAAATVDLEHDRADRAAGRKIQCPVHALWGAHGVVHKCFKPLDEWRAATDTHFPVTGYATPSGHYLAEEIPDVVAGEFIQFFKVQTS